MPPQRRRPLPAPTPHRPKVAGLRKPAAPRRSDDAAEPVEPEQAAELTETPAARRTKPTKPTKTAEPTAPVGRSDDDAATGTAADTVDTADPDGADEDLDDAFDDDAFDDADDDADDTAEDADADDTAEDADEDAEDADEVAAADVDDEHEDRVVATATRGRPAGKRRSSGLRAPTAAADLVTAERQARAQRERVPQSVVRRGPARARLSPVMLALVLFGVAVVLAGLAVWFRGEANATTEGADASNVALTDTAATTQLIGEVRTALESSFAIDYRDLDKTRQAVNTYLIGDARKEYDQQFGALVELAPQAKRTVTMQVLFIAPAVLRGDDAQVLVYARQTAREPKGEALSDAVIRLGAHRVGGHWKISGIDLLAGPSGS